MSPERHSIDVQISHFNIIPLNMIQSWTLDMLLNSSIRKSILLLFAERLFGWSCWILGGYLLSLWSNWRGFDLPMLSIDLQTCMKEKTADDDVKRLICVGFYSFDANFSQLIWGCACQYLTGVAAALAAQFWSQIQISRLIVSFVFTDLFLL